MHTLRPGPFRHAAAMKHSSQATHLTRKTQKTKTTGIHQQSDSDIISTCKAPSNAKQAKAMPGLLFQRASKARRHSSYHAYWLYARSFDTFAILGFLPARLPENLFLILFVCFSLGVFSFVFLFSLCLFLGNWIALWTM